MDFKQDFIDLIRIRLDKDKIDYSMFDKNDEKILYLFYDCKKRFVDDNVSFTIEYSKEYLITLESLSSDMKSDLHKIEERLKNKQCMYEFLSKDVFKPINEDKDTLLKNWNINHAHLPTDNNSHLLFFICENEMIYFIDVCRHPKGKDWFQKYLLQIVYDNWPFLMKVKKGANVINPIEDEDVQKVSSNTFVLIQLRDCVAIPSKFGISSSGISNEAVRKVQPILHKLQLYQEYFQDHMAKIIEDNKKQFSLENVSSLELSLEIENNMFIAYDKNYQIKISMFKVPQ